MNIFHSIHDDKTGHSCTVYIHAGMVYLHNTSHKRCNFKQAHIIRYIYLVSIRLFHTDIDDNY